MIHCNIIIGQANTITVKQCGVYLDFIKSTYYIFNIENVIYICVIIYITKEAKCVKTNAKLTEYTGWEMQHTYMYIHTN